MVKKDFLTYLFIGQDAGSKDAQLEKLKEKYLKSNSCEFNSDTIFASDKDLTLKSLQEKLLFLPLASEKRIVIIKNGQDLKADLKEFILRYAASPQVGTILVIDIDRYDPKDAFINAISKSAQISRFSQSYEPNVFELNKNINLKKAAASLRLLKVLMANGEKPEWILGSLRSIWEKYLNNPLEFKRRVKLLLQCDLAIKTGTLKADFALERLVVNLCGLKNFSS